MSRPTTHRTVDDLYRTTPPWDIGRPQPAFLRLAEEGAIRGRVLDVGCGTGEHVLMSSALGLDATGVDLVHAALTTAESKARDRRLPARFRHQDALRLTELGESFDTVLDCGLFHIFHGTDRTTFVASVRSALAPGGRYFLLCISDEEPLDWGPHKVSRADLHTAFADGWRIDSIEPSTIDINVEPGGVRAWLAALTRR